MEKPHHKLSVIHLSVFRKTWNVDKRLPLSWSTVSSFYFNFEPCIYNNFFFIKEKEKKESNFIYVSSLVVLEY